MMQHMFVFTEDFIMSDQVRNFVLSISRNYVQHVFFNSHDV